MQRIGTVIFRFKDRKLSPGEHMKHDSHGIVLVKLKTLGGNHGVVGKQKRPFCFTNSNGVVPWNSHPSHRR